MTVSSFNFDICLIFLELPKQWTIILLDMLQHLIFSEVHWSGQLEFWHKIYFILDGIMILIL